MSSRTSRRKKSSREEHVPTQWSEWEWKQENSCYSRYRLNKYGEYEFEYDQPGTNQSTASSSYDNSRRSETPRYAAPLPDTTYGASGTFGTSPVTPGYTTSALDNTTAAFGSLDLSKGKEIQTEYASPSVTNSYTVEPSIAQSLPAVDSAVNSNWYPGRSNSGYDNQYSQNTGMSSYPQSSHPYGNPYPQSSGSSSYQQSFYSGETSQDTVPHNPVAQQPSNYIGTNTRGLEDPLDPNFAVCHGSEFRVGRLFKILWAEPIGANGTLLSESVRSRSHKFREEFVHKIRRFVVVKTFNAHCLCLPIQTYRLQGARKPGVQAEHHAVIYSNKEVEYPGENLIKKAIRVEMTTPKEKLDPASRINYAKVYTIEYNVKVFFIGKVHAKSRHQILADYQITQSLPTHEPGNDYDDSSTGYEDSTGGEGPSR